MLPARDALVERLERLANVGFALSVDVEVIAELVHEGGEVLELAVQAPDSRLCMRAWDESLDGVGMFVEKLDVKTDADDGIDAGLGDLVLLGLSQRLGFILLRSERRAIRNRPRIAAIVRMA